MILCEWLRRHEPRHGLRMYAGLMMFFTGLVRLGIIPLEVTPVYASGCLHGFLQVAAGIALLVSVHWRRRWSGRWSAMIAASIATMIATYAWPNGPAVVGYGWLAIWLIVSEVAIRGEWIKHS